MRFFLLSIGLVLGFVASAWAAGCGIASRQGEVCNFEADATKYFPEEVKIFGKGSAARICMREGKRTVALFASPPKANDLGVCFFWTRDMDAAVPAGRFPDRYLEMAPGKSPCPRQDDPAYVNNSGVPDGIFAEMATRWNSGRFAFPKMQEPGGHPIEFAKIYRTANGRKRFVLSSIEYQSSLPTADYPSTANGGTFDFVVNDNDHPSITYYFHSDWKNGDLRITDVEYLVSGC